MKFFVGLVVLSVAVMVVMIFQTVLQELDLHKIKIHMVESAAAVKRKEKSIVDMKIKIKDMKTKLVSVTSNIDLLKKNKAETENSIKESTKTLQACNRDKEAVEKKEVETAEAISKLKADHAQAKAKAEEDIKILKQQILERDKAVCALVDTTKEEARKLCGISEARK